VTIKYLKSKPFLFISVILIICAALFVYARTRPNRTAFGLAEDFPRGALVYAQFKDLPQLIKQWDQSRLKQQYLDSANYKEFQHHHLALKLIERWEEFNSALGFPLDAAAISGAAETSAALAIYDIGRLDMVFIAPISDEKVAATKFLHLKERFEETALSDGTIYYRHEFQADRGRQKQVFAFATAEGKLILATNEQLLLRAIANIHGKSSKDRLSDDPAFNTLSSVVNPHFVTVWVDQTKLNDDYYFKHYWLMQNVTELKSMRAGIFDLELQDGQWIERRDFLTTGNPTRQNSQIAAPEVALLQSQIPDDVPFLKIQSLGNDPSLTASLIHDTLLDRRSEQARRGNSWSWTSYDDSEFYSACNEDSEDYDRYAYPGPEYDSTIDDPYDARTSRNEKPGENPLHEQLEHQFAQQLQQAIGPTHPSAAIVATSPHTITGPLFVEFRRVAILTLQTPANLNRQILEDAISKAVESRLTVAGPGVNLKWADHQANARSWRELELPMLGWHFCYALRDRELLLGNSPELLTSILDAPRGTPLSSTQSEPSLDNLTIIRLDQRKQAFDDIVGKLDAEAIAARQKARKEAKESPDEGDRSSAEFFSENLNSLLDASSAVTKIEIRRSSSANRLHEEIAFTLK
jgi:hypothetical protein